MRFVAQLEEGPDHRTAMNFGGGVGYLFDCKEGKTAKEIADFYLKAYLSDIKKLNILPADIYPKATEHIKEQIELIKQLEKKKIEKKHTIDSLG